MLLLLEHPHVLTLGVRGDGGRSHILATSDTLGARGVEVHETGRGGDITYHGPGQIVGYPIIDLQPDRCDVHRYVRDIEEVLIRTAADYGVAAQRVDGLTGVWVGRDKLAAIGVRIARWVTSHGFALQRDDGPGVFRSDRAVRHCGPGRHVARPGARPAGRSRRGRRPHRRALRRCVRANAARPERPRAVAT